MNFLIAATFLTTYKTSSGTECLPVTGESHGPSVSDNIWLMFAISATILKCCNFSMTDGMEK